MYKANPTQDNSNDCYKVRIGKRYSDNTPMEITQFLGNNPSFVDNIAQLWDPDKPLHLMGFNEGADCTDNNFGFRILNPNKKTSNQTMELPKLLQNPEKFKDLKDILTGPHAAIDYNLVRPGF